MEAACREKECLPYPRDSHAEHDECVPSCDPIVHKRFFSAGSLLSVRLPGRNGRSFLLMFRISGLFLLFSYIHPSWRFLFLMGRESHVASADDAENGQCTGCDQFFHGFFFAVILPVVDKRGKGDW